MLFPASGEAMFPPDRIETLVKEMNASSRCEHVLVVCFRYKIHKVLDSEAESLPKIIGCYESLAKSSSSANASIL
jgi:hypothetical protein